MIVSHAHRFIFVKTKKVGGTSLEIALSSVCGPSDIITPISPRDERTRRQLGYRGPQNFRRPIREWGPRDWLATARRRSPPVKYWNHIPAAEIRARVGPDVWSRYLTFSVIRDPFDVVVSKFFWKRRHADAGARGTQAFRRYLMDNPGHIVENRLIYEIDGEPAVDCLLRYENLPEDLERLSRRLGFGFNIHDRMRTVRAKSDYRPARGASAREMFAGFDAGVRLVSILGAAEIDRGGYEPP